MALDIPHSKGWERILRSGGPESANPVSGPQVSSRPNEKGVGGRHGETVLEFSCPNRPGTKLTCQASGTATRARPPTRQFFRHSEEVGAGGSSRSSYPATPPPTTARKDTGKAVSCRTTCSCMTTICVTASTTGHRDEPPRVSFRCWMVATAQGRRPRHLVKIQVVSRPNCSLVPAGPSFPSRSPIPYIIPSDPLLPLDPRSALFPTFTCLFSQHNKEPPCP